MIPHYPAGNPGFRRSPPSLLGGSHDCARRAPWTHHSLHRDKLGGGAAGVCFGVRSAESSSHRDKLGGDGRPLPPRQGVSSRWGLIRNPRACGHGAQGEGGDRKV